MTSIEERALTVDRIKRLILAGFEIPQGGGDLIEPCTPDELFGKPEIELAALCRLALDELVREGKIEKDGDVAANGAPFYRRV